MNLIIQNKEMPSNCDACFIRQINSDLKNDIRHLPFIETDLSTACTTLAQIADLVDGTIDHFDRDDALDLLYQIKDVVEGER